jgi:CheY-like chemotaxis protein
LQEENKPEDGAVHTKTNRSSPPRPPLLSKRSPPHPVDAPRTSKLFVNKRVLVVDDAPSNRKMLIRVLAKSGHVCDQAQDGQVAVQRYLASIAASAEGQSRDFQDGTGEMKDSYSTDEKRDGSADGHADGRADGNVGSQRSDLEDGLVGPVSGTGYDMILMDYEMPVMNGPTATARLRELGCMCPIVGVTGNVLGADVDFFLAQGADCVLPKPLQMSALEEVWTHFVAVQRSVSFGGDV